ncbi:MAG: hypothetical protein L0312_25130 [Acidobacteria bacterium]|nr:hypothetical protein [Acidobacteriota bacterium]
MDKHLLAQWFKGVWHPAEEELLRYVDNELPAHKTAKIRQHLGACWSCRLRKEKIEAAISSFVEYLHNTIAPNVPSPRLEWRSFGSNLRQVVSQTRRSGLFSIWSSVRSVFLASSLPLRLAAGLLLLAAGIVWMQGVNPLISVSADELLEKAAEAHQQRIRQAPQPVVYQKVEVRRKAAIPAPDEVVTLEIWNDTTHSRFRHYLQDSQGRRLIARETDPALARLSPDQAGPVPAVLIELERAFRANHLDWRQPLSAEGYSAWRQSAGPRTEEVFKMKQAGEPEALVLKTVPKDPKEVDEIVEAQLVLRAKDWHPLEQHLKIQGEGEIREYELAELASQVVALNHLELPVFVDPMPPVSAQIPKIITAKAATLPSPSELIEAEIQAHYSLHRLKACLGEPIEVIRTRAGQIEVAGLAATPERKEDLRAALEGVPFLKIRIRTMEEALQQHSSSSQDLTNSSPMKEDSSADQTVTVRSTRLPIQDRLEQILRARAEGFSPGDERAPNQAADLNALVAAWSNQVTAVSRAALAEAWALRRLAESFPGKRDHLSKQSLWLLEVMMGDHLAEMKAQVSHGRKLLAPVLVAYLGESSTAVSGEEQIPPDPLKDSDWSAGALLAFAAVDELDRLIHGLFAQPSLPREQADDAAQRLALSLPALENQFENLEAAIARGLIGNPNWISRKEQ